MPHRRQIIGAFLLHVPAHQSRFPQHDPRFTARRFDDQPPELAGAVQQMVTKGFVNLVGVLVQNFEPLALGVPGLELPDLSAAGVGCWPRRRASGKLPSSVSRAAEATCGQRRSAGSRPCSPLPESSSCPKTEAAAWDPGASRIGFVAIRLLHRSARCLPSPASRYYETTWVKSPNPENSVLDPILLEISPTLTAAAVSATRGSRTQKSWGNCA